MTPLVANINMEIMLSIMSSPRLRDSKWSRHLINLQNENQESFRKIHFIDV